MPKEKKVVPIVEPKSTSYVEYVELGRTETPDPVFRVDHVSVTHKKICRGNPEETFETEQTMSYDRPWPVEEVVEVVEPVKENVKRVALGVIPLPNNLRRKKNG